MEITQAQSLDSKVHYHREESYDPWRLVKLGLAILVSVASVSTVVYYLLGQYYDRHWSVMDCLFMTVITLSTIGYGDWLNIKDLYLVEIFTMILGLAGIGVPAFIISTMTGIIVEGVVGNTMRRRKMDQEIARIHGHVLICGAGSVGEHCIAELMTLKKPFVVIDRDEERLKTLCRVLGHFPYIVGNADRDEILAAAGIERAFGLMACLTEDKDNLFVTLTARVLNPKVRIVSKGIEDHVRRKMLTAGANGVVSPTAIGGLRMVSEMVRPVTVGFLDSMIRERTNTRFAELTVEPKSPLKGRTLLDSKLREHADVLIVGAKPAGAENYLYNPTASFVLEPGCVVVLLASLEEVEKLKPLFLGA